MLRQTQHCFPDCVRCLAAGDAFRWIALHHQRRRFVFHRAAEHLLGIIPLQRTANIIPCHAEQVRTQRSPFGSKSRPRCTRKRKTSCVTSSATCAEPLMCMAKRKIGPCRLRYNAANASSFPARACTSSCSSLKSVSNITSSVPGSPTSTAFALVGVMVNLISFPPVFHPAET